MEKDRPQYTSIRELKDPEIAAAARQRILECLDTMPQTVDRQLLAEKIAKEEQLPLGFVKDTMGIPSLPRGFAAMSKEQRSEIARKGGKEAQRRGREEGGNVHTFTSEEATRAGRIGGKSVASDRARMAEMGRNGGSRRPGEGSRWVVVEGEDGKKRKKKRRKSS